jgi:hypothetical protein
MKPLRFRVLAMIFFSVSLFKSECRAWNIPGYMLSGAIAYQILQRENPSTIPIVRSVLEKNPWYEMRWKPQLEKLPEPERDEMLFMLAARWADDIRTLDKAESHLPWHYVDFPFEPEGEPASIPSMQPPQENILTAIALNERAVRSESDATKRGIALAWLFHLVGDIHQPLHAIQLFSQEYPNGDRGGGDSCVRVAQDRTPLSLHRLWDGLITSSNNTRTLRNIAIELQSRFSKASLSKLAVTKPEAWAKESFEIATKIAYQNGAFRGTPKGQRKECREVTDAAVLPAGYAAISRKIADRQMMLSGYRLAFSTANRNELTSIPLALTCRARIKSDTPLSRIATPAVVCARQNIGFHYVWTVAYPLPIDRRGHESKTVLADHGYPSRLHPIRRGTAAEKSATNRCPVAIFA